MMDHNVDPSSTYQVMDRLIKANKTFDLLVVPEADHGTRGPWTRYTNRNLFDYFVRNLLDEQPPDWNVMSTTASAAPGSPQEEP
jgi:dipeptidyl aminopeptidase/acylaminoacyl peptidase